MGCGDRVPNLDEVEVGVEGRAKPAMVVGIMGGTELPGSHITSTYEQGKIPRRKPIFPSYLIMKYNFMHRCGLLFRLK